nr:ABC transporter permease [Bacilli bacterium]
MNILNKLTVKHLKMNKKRTIVSIIGIILSTALMVGVGLLSSTLREVLITDVKESRGEFHAKFVNVEPDKINLVKNNTNVDNIYYAADLGYSLVDNENIEDTTKPYYHIYGLEDNYLDKLNLIEGNMPKNSDEVVISNYMNANGMDLKVGDSITVKYGKRYFNDEEYTKTEYQDGEVLKESGDSKTYKIVGIIKKDVLESYSQAGYSIYTKFDNSKDNKLVVYVNYKKITKAKEITRTIANNLGFTPLDDEGYYFNEVSYNDSLLALYGVTSYDNMIKSMMSVLFVI